MDIAINFSGKRVVPVMMQAETTECGLACLSMIATYHGHNVTTAELRRKYSNSLKGTTLKRLIEIANDLGLHSRAVRLEIEDLRRLSKPCIIHWGMDHFVVLTDIDKNGAIVNDPAIGRQRITKSALHEKFTGVALELEKGAEFRGKEKAPPPSLRKLSGPIEGVGRSLLTVFGLALSLELLALLSPLVFQVVFDQVIPSRDSSLLNVVGFGFLTLLITQTIISALRSWTVTWLSTTFNMAWSNSVFRHLIRLPSNYFMARHMGDVVSRFGAVQIIQQTLTTRFVTVIIDGIMAALTLGMMLYYSASMTTIALSAFILYSVIRVSYYHVLRSTSYSNIADAARQQSTLLESIKGIQSIRLCNQEAAQSAKYLDAAVATTNSAVGLQRLDLKFKTLSSLVFGLQRLLVIWLGSSLVLSDQISSGMLLAFIAYVDQFSNRGGALVDYTVDLRLLKLQGERLSDITDSEKESNVDTKFAGDIGDSSLSFEGVSFRYSDSDPWILNNASFFVEPGSVVAIIGPSGTGKSTLVRLIAGLVEPIVGSIKVGGIDVQRLGKRQVREHCAFVTQEEQFFTGTIADNIAFFDPDVRLEKVIEAASIAEIHNEILSMPLGYQTLMGDIGSTLSAGQQQRLQLARALFRNPRILVLDESTSNLDIFNEKKIFENLNELGITRIVIAHRPETIASASIAYVLMGGQLRTREKDLNQPTVDAEVNAAIH